jgi:hypothetical protein
MAAGTVVLGGIAVGPAVLVRGVVLAAQGAKAHEQAARFSRDVDVAINQVDALVALLHRGERRVQELSELTTALSKRAHAAMDRIEEVLPTFDDDDDAHRDRLREALLLCGALRQIMECRVLDDAGQLDGSAGELIEKFKVLTTPEMDA